MLTNKYTKEEVVKALKSMGPMKASGDDSFSALFYQHCWYIMGREIIDYCLKILNEGV